MESRAKLLGHPVHQMLVVFPVGLLTTAVVADVLYIATGTVLWAVMAFWLMVGGVGTGLVAAPFGLKDWLAIPSDTRAKRVGLLHGAGNAVVLLLYFLSIMMRIGDPGAPEVPARALSFAGGGLALVTAWLGGELINRLAIGVDPDAHLDASSSLRRRR